MHAAVVRSFDRPPRYEHVEAPHASGPHELVVDVLAAGLHPRVRSTANGSHYTTTGELPLIPGIDGVGRTADGDLLYFVLPDDEARLDGRADRGGPSPRRRAPRRAATRRRSPPR